MTVRRLGPRDFGLPQRSRTRRNAQVALLGARVGTTAASARARRVFASAERRIEIDHDMQLRTAEQVAESLGQMKGALMKLGQMASFIDEGLPQPVRDALSQLQSHAPPMAAELAAAVIAEELGGHPDEIFEQWDADPIAAASIGQVHRAITRAGEPVAVKVQYPGVADAIKADLANAGLVFGALGLAFPGFDPAPVIDELKERITEELDYQNEARNQMLFADFYQDHPFIHVPRVVTELSTKRVLVSELAVGATFDEVESWPAEERNRVAETLYRFVFRSLYRLQAFNGDPHPGNYLFGRDGRVTFLDFGLVRRFSDTELHQFRDMITAMVVDRDPVAFRGAVERAGLLTADAPVSTEEVAEFFSHFYKLVERAGPVTTSPEYASTLVRQTFNRTSTVTKYTTVPASFVLIQRINLGLFALLGRLRATADWRAITEEIWPWVDAEPQTPLGEAEAHWLRLRHGLS